MNHKIILISALLTSSFLWAQSIKGTITNKQNKPEAETEIVMTLNKSKFSAITDEKGEFSIQLKENGEYALEIIKDGTKIIAQMISINGNISRDFKIEEPEKTEKIEGITLTAKKKLFERKVDRLVFNVENSIASQGIDVLEALAKTPMVRSTDDAISIAGKSNIAIMVNEKLLNLSGQELINYLKTLRSDDVAKIEVITTPPARYDAEGKSGLINIVLKKNTALGWNGSLQTSGNYYGNKPIVSTKSSVSFNYQSKKLSLSTNLSTGNNYWEYNSYNYLRGTEDDNYWNTDTQYSNNYKYKAGNIKAEYKFNDKNLIGLNYNYSYSNPLETSKNTTSIYNTTGLMNIVSDNANKNHRKIHNATAFYDLKLDSEGGKLSLSANMMLNDANAKNYYNTTTHKTVSTFVNPISRYRIYSGQADFEKNFSKIKTEAGLKYTKIKNDSEFNFFNIENGANIINKERTNTFLYNEENYAAYASANFKINDKWEMKGGIRYEHTNLEGISMNDDSSAKVKYGKLFPTAYISYKPQDNHAFSLNYSKRITRPYFGNLNPFKYYTSEFEYTTGNPYLLPSFSDNFEFGYVLKNNLNVTLYYNYNKNNSDRVQVVNGNLKYSIVKNFYNENQAGLNISYNYNKLKWLESNIFVNAFYAKSQSFDPEALPAPAGYSANFNVDNNFFLNKNKTLTLMVGLWGTVPNRSGNTYFNGNTELYTGLKINLMQKNLTINLHINDLLNTYRSKGTEYYPNYNVEYWYKGNTRNINLSVTYKLGNNNIKGATKKVQFEESKRTGEN